jgi:hypothetical protein
LGGDRSSPDDDGDRRRGAAFGDAFGDCARRTTTGGRFGDASGVERGDGDGERLRLSSLSNDDREADRLDDMCGKCVCQPFVATQQRTLPRIQHAQRRRRSAAHGTSYIITRSGLQRERSASVAASQTASSSIAARGASAGPLTGPPGVAPTCGRCA